MIKSSAYLKRHRTQVLLLAIGVLAVPLVLLSLMAASQIRNIDAALRGREVEALRQTARLAAWNVSLFAAEEEAALFQRMDLASRESLAESLRTLESDNPGLLCFALLSGGTLLYPPAAETNAPVIDAILAAEPKLLAQLSESGLIRACFPLPILHSAVSFRRLTADGADGMIGLCWPPSFIRAWTDRAALETLPAGTTAELLDFSGEVLAQFPLEPAAPSAVPGHGLSATAPLGPDSFPWIVRIGRENPAELRQMIERQRAFYKIVVALMTVLTLIGAWIIVALALREIELARMKTEFAANVSHELRTPLALIRASAEALANRDRLPRARMERYIEIIEKQSHRLSNVVTTVLSLSRVEKKGEPLALAPSDLCAFTAGVLDDVRVVLHERGFTLRTHFPEAPVRVLLDREALHLALANLLDNAVKFSGDAKDITVSIEDRGDRAAVLVTDLGIGIAPALRERVFDSYFRVEADNLRRTAGTGLGLALAREIVQAHGGDIHVDSALGKGSTFVVILPKTQDDPHAVHGGSET